VMQQNLLCDLELGLFGELNEFGVDIWNQLEQPADIDEIIEKLKEFYDIEQIEIRYEIDQFLKLLQSKGFIESE